MPCSGGGRYPASAEGEKRPIGGGTRGGRGMRGPRKASGCGVAKEGGEEYILVRKRRM